jgi:iron complex transport system substrate-binding protein
LILRIALLFLMFMPLFAQAAPQRIVSLNPCLDDILVDVADKKQIRTISHYSHDPRASSITLSVAKQFRKTYGTAEEILIEKPDLVLADIYMPAATRRALTLAGINMLTYNVPKDPAESLSQIRQLASAVGQKERGNALIARIEQALQPSRKTEIPVLMRSDSGFILGSGTVMDDLLSRSGFSNASGDMGMKMSDLMPIEALLLKPPSLLFVISDNDVMRARHPAMRKIMQTIPSYILPDKLVNCAGPSMIAAMKFLSTVRQKLP